MKVSLKLFAALALATAASSCSSFLDVNTNPNNLTTNNPPTPAAVLAQALNTTATNYTGGSPSYNSYASFAADYWGRSGDVSGYAEEQTYNYTSNYYQGLWSATFDNLNDYDFIQKQGTGTNYAFHASIARIMKVYNYLLLVDQYGDIPYSQSLKGVSNLTPTYDKAADIYKDLLVQLQGAVSDINATTALQSQAGSTIIAVGSEDVVFGGGAAGMINWKRFANSLQLRILLRQSSTNDATLNAYVRTQMAALQTAATTGTGNGFIQTDVVVNPGYVQSGGQQNPFYDRYGVTAGGSSATERFYIIPTNFVLSQYVNYTDPRRSQLYTLGSNGTYTGTDLGEPNPPGSGDASLFARGGGILKAFNAPTILMLAAENYFSKAEAETRGLFTGGDVEARKDYDNGVQSSFLTFYRPATTAPGVVIAPGATSSVAGFAQYTTYTTSAANVNRPQVSYAAAITNGSQVSTILLQKYLAENSIASVEALDDYRRTLLPNIDKAKRAGANPFPRRLLYPQTEINTNTANVPKGTNQFTPIFWQR
jgi:hypothetical protein